MTSNISLHKTLLVISQLENHKFTTRALYTFESSTGQQFNSESNTVKLAGVNSKHFIKIIHNYCTRDII